MNDRQTAFRVLNRIERNSAYSNLALDAELRQNRDQEENAAFSSFVTALVYGVLERKITLDWFLSGFLKKPIKKLRPEVLTVLRMGVYQLKFMDKVPVSAAVNESVKLVKNNGCAYAAGLVNSVLRKAAGTELSYPDRSDFKEFLSVRYSCPVPLVEHYIRNYGEEDAEGILASSLGAVPTALRVNTLKTDAESLIKALAAEGIEATCGQAENTLVLENGGALEQTEAYRNGLFHVQDTASALCVQALDLHPGQTVLDLCAAPGGKTFTIAERMQNKGEIFAFDLYPQRVQLIDDGASRLGISIVQTAVCDASVFVRARAASADRVLCDVPCSGLGTIRRKPEIRYKDLGFIDNLTDLQYNILINASKYLKAGGVLVYSTCTLNRAENEEICDRFLREHPDFQKLHDYTTLLPHKDGTDGFFFARLWRNAPCKK